jgi:hypothetical protein
VACLEGEFEARVVMQLDTSRWSGDGLFTGLLVDRLRRTDAVVFARVEDASTSRSAGACDFISNDLFVAFASRRRVEHFRRFGLLPLWRTVSEPAMTIAGLGQALARAPEIGAPDHADEGMLQYLRTERVVPPRQTRGYKLVELVRVYGVGSAPRD